MTDAPPSDALRNLVIFIIGLAVADEKMTLLSDQQLFCLDMPGNV
ncbi:MAG: hypothetical protein WC586_07020 [Methanoregula sp.]